MTGYHWVGIWYPDRVDLGKRPNLSAWLDVRCAVCTIVNWKRSHIIPAFIFGHMWFWRHHISRSDQSEYCLHAVSVEHRVCLHVGMAVSRLRPSDVRHTSRAWTLIGQSRYYFSPERMIWLYFIRLWCSPWTCLTGMSRSNVDQSGGLCGQPC